MNINAPVLEMNVFSKHSCLVNMKYFCNWEMEKKITRLTWWEHQFPSETLICLSVSWFPFKSKCEHLYAHLDWASHWCSALNTTNWGGCTSECIAFYLFHHICDIINNSSTEISLSYMPVCVERVRIKITPGAQGREPRPSRRSSEHQALSRHSSPFPPLLVLQCGSSTLLLG